MASVPAPAGKRAAIYVRVSSAIQEDNYSLESQIKRCRAHALAKGYSVSDAHVYQDVASGFTLDRPKLSELRAALARGEFDVIVVNTYDRWSSEVKDAFKLFVDLGDAEAALESVTQGTFEDTPIGRTVVIMYTVGRELWLEDHKERTQRGMRARIESGRPRAGLKALYGYRWLYEPDSKGKPVKTTLEVYEPEAAIVRRVFRHLASGGTATELSRWLTAEGIPAPGKNQQGQPGLWSASNIGRMVREDAYIGIAWANKYRCHYKNKKRVRVELLPESERIRIPGEPFPAIVDPETAAKARAQLDYNKKLMPKRATDPSVFLLRGGFARCGICDYVMTATHRDNRKSVYRCPAAYKLTHVGKHVGASIHSAILDREIWEYVKLVRANRDYVRQHLEQQAAEATNTDELANLDKALRNIAHQESNLLHGIRMAQSPEVIANLTLEADKLAKAKREMQAERTEALERAAAFERARAALDRFEDAVETDIARLDQMTVAERRDVLTLFGVSVKVWPKGYEQRHQIDMAFDLSAWFDPAFYVDQPEVEDAIDEAIAKGLVPAPTYRPWAAKAGAIPTQTGSNRGRWPPSRRP